MEIAFSKTARYYDNIYARKDYGAEVDRLLAFIVVERHELGLFETDEMRTVMEEHGLDVTHDAEGLTGRGLFIGKRIPPCEPRGPEGYRT